MNKTLRVLAVTAVLGAAATAQAGNGTRTIGFGVVQDSMGGASVGAPLEATTMITNPAGLSGMGPSIDFTATLFNQAVTYSAEVFSGTTTYSGRWHPWFLPTIALALPVGESLTFGLGTGCVDPMGVEPPLNAPNQQMTRSTTWNRRITPSAAYQITKGLSVGVTANIAWAGIQYEAPGGTSLPRDKESAWGYGATVGLSYTPIDMLTLGVAYESKSFFPDFAWTIPPHQVLDPSTGTMVSVPGGIEKLDLNYPQVATVGGSVRPWEALLLAADLEWINWSDTFGKNKPALDTDPQLTGAHVWNMNWRNQVVVKLGAQYAVIPALKIRAGYNYGKSPLDASRAFENIDFPAIAEHHFTLGAGLTSPSGKLTVNVAGVYAREAKLSGANTAQGISSYAIEMSEITFDLGMTYRF